MISVICYVLANEIEKRKIDPMTIAVGSGVSYNTIWNWLNCISTPIADDRLYAVAQYLGMTIEQLNYGKHLDEHQITAALTLVSVLTPAATGADAYKQAEAEGQIALAI